MSVKLQVVVAQLDFFIGDISGNSQRILKVIEQVRNEFHADLIVFPELALSGYSPEDIMLRADFHAQVDQALQTITQATQGTTVVVGHPHRVEGKLYNAASILQNGKLIKHYYKQLLPTYGVFDEKRFFTPGPAEPCIFNVKGVAVGLIICEDMWFPEPIALTKAAGAQLIVDINASPFDFIKPARRVRMLQQRSTENQIPIIYAHWVGGQDDLVFDGGSMVANAQGEICVQGEFYQEQLIPVEIEVNKELTITPAKLPAPLTAEERIYKALVLAVRDYVNKNNFPGILLGISGGIDSALVLAIAVDALGKDRVTAVALPSRYTSDLSMRLLNELIKNFDVELINISIEKSFNTFIDSLSPVIKDLTIGKTEENLQSRCRGVMMMALSNNTGKLVLTTGNKSELAVGYSTLYGDMAGGFDVLKDVSKTWVYRLSHYRNSISPVIPEEIITRPPTAELAHGQTDQDTLPPYEILDQILKLYVEKDQSLTDIIAQGFDKETVQRIITLVNKNEYKRRQAPIGPRVTPRAFTRDRQYPVTSRFKSE